MLLRWSNLTRIITFSTRDRINIIALSDHALAHLRTEKSWVETFIEEVEQHGRPGQISEEAIIRVENLEHSYGGFKAVDGISFTVKKGEIFSFLGPNGPEEDCT